MQWKHFQCKEDGDSTRIDKGGCSSEKIPKTIHPPTDGVCNKQSEDPIEEDSEHEMVQISQAENASEATKDTGTLSEDLCSSAQRGVEKSSLTAPPKQFCLHIVWPHRW
jgi:hypothetical protein